MLYAIFLCFHLHGSCHRLEPGFTSPNGANLPAVVYRTADSCKAAMQALAGYRYRVTPADTRRLRIQVGHGEWYVCMHRHVDTWTPN